MDWQTLWDVLNSQFLTTVLAAGFGLLLLRYETNLREAQEEARVAEEALQAKNETERLVLGQQAEENRIPEPVRPMTNSAANTGVPNRREDAKQIIEQAKAYLLTQATADPDGRHRRTYEKISGHNPLDLAVALRDRGRISEDQFNATFGLFSIWARYARGRVANNVVTNEVYNLMRGYCQQLTG